MKLSAPIYVLKNQAKKLKKDQKITLTEALNQIAMQEGFNSWSLLQSKQKDLLPNTYDELLEYFNPGDLVLIGARPTQGKTSFTIGLFVKAIKKKNIPNYLFTLSETKNNIIKRIKTYNENIQLNNKNIVLNYSNDISADYIIEKTKNTIKENSIIVIDYLQILDEKRINPPLQTQVETLKKYAKEKNCIIIFISQLKREFETKPTKTPTLEDIRLPNPLDLTQINKKIFLYKKTKQTKKAQITIHHNKHPHTFEVKYDVERNVFF